MSHKGPSRSWSLLGASGGNTNKKSRQYYWEELHHLLREIANVLYPQDLRREDPQESATKPFELLLARAFSKP